MEDLLDIESIPKTPSAIITLCVGCGLLLGGMLAWFGAEQVDFRMLRILIALVGAGVGGVIGFLVGVLLVVVLLGALIGLLLAGIAAACAHFLFAYESWLLVLVPVAGGGAIGALVGLWLLTVGLCKQATGRRAPWVVAFVLLLGMSLYFYTGGAQNLRQRAQAQRDQEAQQAEEEKRVVRNKLETAVNESIAVPDSLATNTSGKQAYQTWHRAVRLLQEYHALAGTWKMASLDEKEDCTTEQLAALATATTEPDVKSLLGALKEGLIAARREDKEASAKSTQVSGGELRFDPVVFLSSGPKRAAREKALQTQADESMTRLSLRYSVEFARLPVWRGETPAPGSEDEAQASRLIGSWEGSVSLNGMQVSGVETYRPDGRFLFTGTTTREGQVSAVSYRGTWRISGKKLHTRLLHTSGPTAGKLGTVDVDEIVKLTDEEKTIRDSLGKLETLRKVRK